MHDRRRRRQGSAERHAQRFFACGVVDAVAPSELEEPRVGEVIGLTLSWGLI